MYAYRILKCLSTAPISMQRYQLNYDRRAWRDVYLRGRGVAAVRDHVRPYSWIAAGVVSLVVIGMVFFSGVVSIVISLPILLLLLAGTVCIIMGIRDLWLVIRWYIAVRLAAGTYADGTPAVLTLTDRLFTFDCNGTSTTHPLFAATKVTVSSFGLILQFPDSTYVLPAPCFDAGDYTRLVRQLKQLLRREDYELTDLVDEPEA